MVVLNLTASVGFDKASVTRRRTDAPTASRRTTRPLSQRGIVTVSACATPGGGRFRALCSHPSPKPLVAFAAAADASGLAREEFLDTLKFNADGLLVANAQDVHSGSILMQAFANREAVADTLERGMATFYSRSRNQLWTKGETSNNFIKVFSVHIDCDRDSIIYLGEPMGPSCHTGAHTCFYSRVDGENGLAEGGDGLGFEAALTTLYQLEATIEARKNEIVAEGAKPSWTRKLLDDPELLCSKVREEADELARTWEDDEGKSATASEMADVLYHSMVLLNKQGVPLEDVCKVLRGRFGTSGLEEKASRTPKAD